jgi:hypothetical protein
VELLIKDIPELTTYSDHDLFAKALESMGDYKWAQAHWQQSVRKASMETVRAMSLRGLARCLFFGGAPEIGRRRYDESLKVYPADNDKNRRCRSATYAGWSAIERQFGFQGEARRRREQAELEADGIGQARMRNDAHQYIKSLWGEDPPSAQAADGR